MTNTAQLNVQLSTMGMYLRLGQLKPSWLIKNPFASTKTKKFMIVFYPTLDV
jgi:hypothetical protein